MPTARPFTGAVTHMRDGDTLEIGSMAIRSDGIAAPEWNTPTGEAATAALREMVLGNVVSCELTGRASYDRCIDTCFLGDLNIEAAMVRHPQLDHLQPAEPPQPLAERGELPSRQEVQRGEADAAGSLRSVAGGGRQSTARRSERSK